MKQILRITKALSDENRVRSLYALKEGELCVCQIVELLGLAPSTVSKHLSLLRNAKLIDSRKEGRWIYYRLVDENVSKLTKETLSWFFSQTGNQARLQKDKERLAQILQHSPEELCRR